MNGERKQEIVDAIVKQFEVTGLRPARGKYEQVIGGVECACAVGVFSANRSKMYSINFTIKLGLIAGELSITGVESGFDGEGSDRNKRCDGFVIGAAVWERVKHLAVEAES